MSPSEDTTKALLAALESINLEQTARDDAPSAASPKEHADAISVASQTNEPEPVEQVLSAGTGDHPSQVMPDADTDISSLADRLARLNINTDDDGQDVSSSSGSSTHSEDLSQQESPLPKPAPQVDGAEEDQDLSEVTDPTSASTPDDGVFALDSSSDEQEEPTVGSIAPPPSPAGSSTTTTRPPSSAEPEEPFRIQPSALGGLGAFAARDLHRGETILVERPLLRTTHFQLMLDYYNLSDEAKQAYLSLHGADDGDRFSRIERIKQLNSFSIPNGLAIFATASRFNHACPPARNVEYAFDAERGAMVFTVARDRALVPAGAELRISYGGEPVELYSTYGFRCACGACTPLTDEDLRAVRELEFGGGGEWDGW